MSEGVTHWDAVYTKRPPTEVTWYQAHLRQSLEWIDSLGLPLTTRIVDVGGGASTLVDDLLVRGFARPRVLDLSSAALARSRARLGARAEEAEWIAGDVRAALLEPGSVDLWHDRAAFHFQVEDAGREAYLHQLRVALAPQAHVILASFAPDGPEKCSGLPVRRHAPEELLAALGEGFSLVSQARELHVSPGGREQAFAYALCRRD